MSEAHQSTAEVVEFCCGKERWHEELNDYIRSGEALRHGRKDNQATVLWCRDGGNGSMLGYACLRSRLFNKDPDVPSLLITHLALDQKHQGQGEGKAMLEAIIQFAASGGARVIELFVHEENAPAISLYQRAGFEFLPGQVYVDQETGDRYPAMVRGV
ncbi:MAG: GNAT family N-acetyltransferase [Candidatus Binatia bacterium]